jgi:hypothetical protein
MPTSFSRSHPDFRARRSGRGRAVGAVASTSRPPVASNSFRAEPAEGLRAARRTLPGDAIALLGDATPLREPLLLAMSHGRAVLAASIERLSERGRIAAFESAYLSLAALVPREFAVGEAQPSIRLVAAAMQRVHLIPEDRYLAEQLTALYGVPGWEGLDFEGVLEWCSRVRVAVAARSNAESAQAFDACGKTLFKG